MQKEFSCYTCNRIISKGFMLDIAQHFSASICISCAKYLTDLIKLTHKKTLEDKQNAE